ncbi:MAG: hypothetical protein WCG99_00715 [Candidatus Berkelbacteria bacterium]
MSSEFLPKSYDFKMGYIILYIPSLNIAPKLDIDGEKLYAKDKFHMSILGVKNYVEALSKNKKITLEQAESEILKESGKILEKKPVRFVRFKDDIKLVQEADKKTIVIMCEAEGIETFFEELQNVLKIDIATQPVHSTIYTREDGRGIGMINEEELSDFSRPLSEVELNIAKEALNWISFDQGGHDYIK